MSLDIELLESSFKLVAPRADELADRFYNRLFTEHPEVRPMFKDDMTEQKSHLASALGAVVGNLRNPDKLKAFVAELGQRHIDYGVQREHYPIVGQTLLAALAEVAGDAWNDDLQRAWSDAYGAIQSIIFESLDSHNAAA